MVEVILGLLMRIDLLISCFVFTALLAAPSVHAQNRAAPGEPPSQDERPAVRPPSSFHDRLVARLAELSVPADEVQEAARAYEAGSIAKSMAVAVTAHRTWRAVGRTTLDAAVRSALEGCQIYYGEPCVPAASGERIETKAAQDMPRAKYSGRFEAERVPAVRDNLFQRADVVGYRAFMGPKAAAYHPLGSFFIVTGAPGQFDAEERVLAQCNDDPRRTAEYPEQACFLYTVGDRVVLPQRLTTPRPSPTTVAEAFAYLGMPGYAASYAKGIDHKAIAIAPERQDTFAVFKAPSAEAAEERAMEGCQLSYRTHCVLLASDDALHAPEIWKAERPAMPRLAYNGTYAPEHVPLFYGNEDALTAYASLPAPKAMVIRPRGTRVRTATGTTPAEAQSKALAACNDDLDYMPCFVYAVDERVVIDQRRTEPVE
jgi:hypothetical protein